MAHPLRSAFLCAVVLAAGCAHRAAHAPASTAGDAAAAEHIHHRFEDVEQWAAVFDAPERDAWQKPDEVLAALALRPDARVADIGAGTGYFTLRLSRALPRGRIHGVDVEVTMVRHLEERARTAGLSNVVGVLATADDPRVPEPVDLVLVVDTYHHLQARPDYFRRLRAHLRPGGRVAVIDFRPDAPIGPPPGARVAREQLVRELGEAGYRLTEEHTFLPYQHFLVFTPVEDGSGAGAEER
ncbi:MAG: methyltransferase domain-containing protein [Myxococcaceae bacterium]|nr:methyltransferase domain-containing protein [Myxococcaceae bacterium]MCI0672202.1 methyltransferase domain-containing protein [Myxococcaceae bacterium]